MPQEETDEKVDGRKKVSICIACHNQQHLLPEALDSCLMQDYPNIEIIVLDDASTVPFSNVETTKKPLHTIDIKYLRSDTPSGTGGSFNKAMAHASGDYIVLLCADDVFTDHRVISDIAQIFDQHEGIVHTSRYYHQFIDGDRRPVRAWRCDDVIELANNPSGLSFRRSALIKHIPMSIPSTKFDTESIEKSVNPQLVETMLCLSNKMFVEASTLVAEVLKKGGAAIFPWDMVAVRIHQSISQNKDYYLKRWTSSPVEEWTRVGGGAILGDFTSLVQIKNNFKTSAVLKECWNFIKLRPINLFVPGFWFYAIISLLTPRFILRKLPHFYRITLGRWLTREVKRPG